MYDLKPKIKISEKDLIIADIKNTINSSKICFECYHGTDLVRLEKYLRNYTEHVLINVEDYLISKNEYLNLVMPVITDDRVFGKMNEFKLLDFFEQDKLVALQDIIDNTSKIIVYGTGASLLKNFDQIIYMDLARYEIQLRYRSGFSNFNMDNRDMEAIQKFKIGYFLDWRVQDKIKRSLKFDYLLDDNEKDYKLISYDNYKLGLKCAISKPFRMVPYFDPGVWGGDWMKKKFNLPDNGSNYAWSFDGVVEENSVMLEYGDNYIEIPAINILFNNPLGLLGQDTYDKYGVEWPIRFDYLDTMNGQNLSLQVHPLKQYIKEQFNMDYTQDESYFIMECSKDAHVYLGLKDDVIPSVMEEALRKAESGNEPFNVEQFINKIPANKFDHFSIPAGTIHCSGKNVVVLEISATPYIFTFKLWDWDRLGMNGKPRPIHLDHGFKNINYAVTTDYVMNDLVYNYQNELAVQKTGLASNQPIETYCYLVEGIIEVPTNGNCMMGNVVDGESVVINGDIIINYGETFVVPANVETLKIESNNAKILIANIKKGA